MKILLSHSIEISASVQDIWRVVSDIEQSAGVISGVTSIEMLEQATGPSITGLRWRETRMWMGQEAVEEMWITDAKDLCYYETRAESHGAVYVSRLEISTDEKTRLTMTFTSRPETAAAKIVWFFTGWMAKRSLKNVIQQDLSDIKAAAESMAAS